MSVTTPEYIYPPLNADSGTLYQGFQTYMQANIPGWKPFSGELDDWLARAFAGIESSLTEIASDVTTAIYRWFGANIVNIPPNDAVAATSLITITVQDTNGPYDIPAFTQMSFPDPSGTLQGFETTADLSIPNGSTTATDVFVQAMTPGVAGNGCTGAGDLDGTTPITYITGLEMTSTSSGGLDAESDPDYLNRLTSELTTFSQSPIVDADFTTLVAAQIGVAAAYTLSAYNPSLGWSFSATATSGNPTLTAATADLENLAVGTQVSGTIGGVSWGTVNVTSVNAPGGTFTVGSSISGTPSMVTFSGSGAFTCNAIGKLNQGGYVTTYVIPSSDADGGPVPDTSGITASIQDKCLGGVVFQCSEGTSLPAFVTVVGTCFSNFVPADVEAAVEAALTTYFKPLNFIQREAVGLNTVATWPPQDHFIRSALINALIYAVPGVESITSLSVGGFTAPSDKALIGVAPYTTPGTMSATFTVA